MYEMPPNWWTVAMPYALASVGLLNGTDAPSTSTALIELKTKDCRLATCALLPSSASGSGPSVVESRCAGRHLAG